MNEYYHKYRNKRTFERHEKQKRIYEVYNYIREKILLRFPIIYSEIILDEYVEKHIVRDRTEFIIESVEEKFERDQINYKPNKKAYDEESWKEEIKGWQDTKDDPKIYRIKKWNYYELQRKIT